MKLVNPLHPARLALLWVLGGIPLERHTAAILRIDEAHQDRVARLRRQTYQPHTTVTFDEPLIARGINGASLRLQYGPTGAEALAYIEAGARSAAQAVLKGGPVL